MKTSHTFDKANPLLGTSPTWNSDNINNYTQYWLDFNYRRSRVTEEIREINDDTAM